MILRSDAPVSQWIADLHHSDEQTGGHPALPAAQVGPARTYLEQLLLDSTDRLWQHVAVLERLYGARYVAPLPRSLRLGIDVPPPQVAAEFRHSAPLAEPLAQAVAEGGVDRLPESDLARLLLNPHALWDLNDSIDTLMPDFWLQRMQEVGVQLARESGIDLYEDFEATVLGKPERTESSAAASRPNLFDFAASELSQDAFLRWLASWADPAHRAADELLHLTAMVFVNRLLECGGLAPPAVYRSLRLCRPSQDVDVLLVNGDRAVFLEAKTHAKDHSGRLQHGKEVVRRELNLPDERIAGVYLETGDPVNCRSAMEAGYGLFQRRDFLDLLDRGVRGGIKNDVFRDFHRYLQTVEGSAQTCTTKG
jgi:hypothetical protein